MIAEWKEVFCLQMLKLCTRLPYIGRGQENPFKILGTREQDLYLMAIWETFYILKKIFSTEHHGTIKPTISPATGSFPDSTSITTEL